nr:probable plastid-lipid-associated protein 8, chloroplastic [Ipomoea batatas]
MDLASEHKILDLKDRIEASVGIWKRKMNAKNKKSTWSSAVSIEKRELFEERAEVHHRDVVQTDRGVLLTTEEHGKVAEMASDLESFCVDEPVKCPLIFGGGVYRSAIGRLFFKTKEMIQILEAPDTVRNKVSFSLFGFLDGEVSLKGEEEFRGRENLRLTRSTRIEFQSGPQTCFKDGQL